MAGEVKSLYHDLVAWADKAPEKTALIRGERRLGYAQWLALVAHVAGRLAGSGVAPGDRVLVSSQGKVEFLSGVLACQAIGALPVPLADLDPGRTRLIAGDAGACALVAPETVPDPAAMASLGLPLVTVGEPPAAPGAPPAPPVVAASDLAMLAYTSGTSSGVQKGVMITHGNLAATVDYLNRFMNLDDSVVDLVASPLNHAMGFGRFRAVLKAGGTLVVLDGPFNLPALLVQAAKHRCNALSSVSAFFTLSLKHMKKHFQAMGPAVRWVEIGSMPMDTRYRQELVECLPEAVVAMEYGLTEAQRSTLIDFAAEPDHIATVGRAAPGTEVMVVDENRRPLAPGQTGEVCVKGPHLARGYWGKEALWQQRYFDGWFQTGDLGVMDRDGYLAYSGRGDDLINVGGFKIGPTQIESELEPHLGGVSFCVCGVDDPQGILNEVPALVVEGGEEPNLAAVREYLRGRLPEYGLPKLVCTVGSIPRTHNGKIIRSKLKELLKG